MITIFYANPNKSGNCAMLLEQVQITLLEKAIPFQVIDLYDEKFNPVMALEEQYTILGAKVGSDIPKYQEIFKNNDKFIFIYPVWWNSMPAQMKGFFDRVLTSKFAFRYEKWKFVPFPVPVGLLKNKKALAFTTTGAARWQAAIFLRHGYKKLFCTDIMAFCGLNAKMYALHNCTYQIETNRKDATRKAAKGLKWLLK
jgi:NAD(P)H dehydrogenase (quinone)